MPRIPATLDDLGLSEEFIIDLLLKTLYMQGARTGQQLVESLCLPFPFVDEQLLMLQQRRFVEVRGTSGPSRAGYMFDLTGAGRDRAREASGVQPVRRARAGAAAAVPPVGRGADDPAGAGHPALGGGRLLLAGARARDDRPDRAGHQLGQVAVPLRRVGQRQDGHGRDHRAAARRVDLRAVRDRGRRPDHGAVRSGLPPSAGGRQPARSARPTLDSLWVGAAGEYDRRYIRVKRPVVLTGGELTLDQLDLEYDYQTKMYQAPFQMKANGGVLIVDDFGRQRVPPRDLLNRWIVPLEKRVDFLPLHTGQQVPGAVRLPADLRHQHRAERAGGGGVPPADPLQDPARRARPGRTTSRSSSAAAPAAGIAYHPEAVEQVYRDFYGPVQIAPRGCHPRDLIDHLCDIARFLEQEPIALARPGRALLSSSYFLDFPTSG